MWDSFTSYIEKAFWLGNTVLHNQEGEKPRGNIKF